MERILGKSRLLVLASTFPAVPGDGTPEFVADLASEQAKHFDTAVLVPAVPGGDRNEQRNGFRVRRFRFFPRRWEDLADGAIIENIRTRKSRLLQVVPFLLAETVATFRAVRRGKPDIIHAHWIIPQGIVARLVAPTTPTVITTLGGDLYALNSGPFRALKRWVLKRAAYVTVMNEEMAKLVVDLGADPDRVEVLPMGADLSTVRPHVPSTDDTLRLLFVGRLVEKKGVSVLLQALRSLEDVNWELTVIGDGPLRESLEASASEGVTFLGTQGREALREAYANSDLALFPSVPTVNGDQDGLPVALLEAMGSGCAIVASDLPGISEAVVEGETGLLVEPDDSDALATAIRELAYDQPRRKVLGAAAAERANERYSKAAIGKRYVEILQHITDQSV